MADISTIWSPSLGIGDWYLQPVIADLVTDDHGASVLDDLGVPVLDGMLAGNGLIVGNDLGSAVLISLFTDATAAVDDVMPEASGDPRGWWGDLGEDRGIGSKIWLRMRSKQTDVALALVKNDIQAALQWLLDDGVAASVEVSTEWLKPGLFGAQVVVVRAGGGNVSLSFDWAWGGLS